MDQRSETIERRLEPALLVAALLTIPAIAIAIEPSSGGEPWDTIASALKWTIWLAFLGELVVMLRVVPDRRAWLRAHPLDVAIVVLTPPFLPAGLQAARAFRLLRLVRLLKAMTLMRRLLSHRRRQGRLVESSRLSATARRPRRPSWSAKARSSFR